MNMLRIIILAAGRGTRMKGGVPKVLQPIANKPMLTYSTDLAIKTQMNLQRLRPILGSSISPNYDDDPDLYDKLPSMARNSKWQVAIDVVVSQELALNQDFQQIIEQYHSHRYTHLLQSTHGHYEPIQEKEPLDEESELEQSVYIKIKPNVIIQHPQLGTGHGVWSALHNSTDVIQKYSREQILLDLEDNNKLNKSEVNPDLDLTLVLYGDVPLVKLETINKMLDIMEQNSAAASINLAFNAADPSGYGRIISSSSHNPELHHVGRISQIIEDKEYKEMHGDFRHDAEHEIAKNADRSICNAGMMLINTSKLFVYLKKECNDILHDTDEENYESKKIITDPSKEIYLTNFVGHSNLNEEFLYLLVDEKEVSGANDVSKLATLENIIQNRIRDSMLSRGVRLIAPETVFFCHDTQIEPGAIVHPYVVFGPNVRIESNAEIMSFSHIHGSIIRDKCRIGPFARLRPNTTLARGVHISNFVEVKNSNLCSDVKANHLSYIGDAIIGAKTNIGAGTILCNYDGKNKNHTIIGSNSFIGANSSIIAPRIIGRNAIVGAGSVIVEDVLDDHVALSRSSQITKKRKDILDILQDES